MRQLLRRFRIVDMPDSCVLFVTGGLPRQLFLISKQREGLVRGFIRLVRSTTPIRLKPIKSHTLDLNAHVSKTLLTLWQMFFHYQSTRWTNHSNFLPTCS